MISPQPAVSVSLPELIGLNAYTRLVIPLVAERLEGWQQDESISAQEKRVLQELLASRGSRALHERTFKIHPYGRTSRDGGHILLTHFPLTAKHVPRYHIKIHAKRQEFKQTQRLTSFLQERFPSLIVAPRYTHRKAHLSAYDVSPGQTLDEVLEQKPERMEELLNQTMEIYFSVALREHQERSPPGLVSPLERHADFLSEHFLKRHDPRMRKPSMRAFLKEFDEIGNYLDSLPTVFCLNDLHGGNVLVEEDAQKLIDLSARNAHLSHGLVKILSHPCVTSDLESKLLGKAKELAKTLPGQEELEKSYYLSQIVDDVLAMQRYLERSQVEPDNKDSWKQQSLVAYNIALRRIKSARINGYLQGKLDEKIQDFVDEHRLDVSRVDDETLDRLKAKHHRPYGSVAAAMQETKKGSYEVGERAIRWGIRKPVWIRRLAGASLILTGLAVAGFAGQQYHVLQARIQEKAKREQILDLIERSYHDDLCNGFNILVEGYMNGGLMRDGWSAHENRLIIHPIELNKDRKMIEQTCQDYGIPPQLALSMYEVHNTFCANDNRGTAGHGLNLLDPYMVIYKGSNDPAGNLREGVERLSKLLDKYSVDREKLRCLLAEPRTRFNPDEYPSGVRLALQEYYGFPKNTSGGSDESTWDYMKNNWKGNGIPQGPKALREIIYNVLRGGPMTYEFGIASLDNPPARFKIEN